MSQEDNDYQDIDLNSDDSHDEELFGPRDPNAPHPDISFSSPESEAEAGEELEQPADLDISSTAAREDTDANGNKTDNGGAVQADHAATASEGEQATNPPTAPVSAEGPLQAGTPETVSTTEGEEDADAFADPVKPDSAPHSATPNPLLPPIGDNAPSLSWDDLLKMDFGPLNDENADMDFEAARRRSVDASAAAAATASNPVSHEGNESDSSSEYPDDEEEQRNISPPPTLATVHQREADAKKGFYYRSRPPGSLLIAGGDDHLFRWTARWARGEHQGRTNKFEDRAGWASPKGTKIPKSRLKHSKSVEDFKSEWEVAEEMAEALKNAAPEDIELPKSPDVQRSPEEEVQEEWEDFKSNTSISSDGLEQALYDEFAAQEAEEAEASAELPFAPVVVDSAEADGEQNAVGDDESQTQPSSRPELHISTSDGKLHRPIAIRPSGQSTPPAHEPETEPEQPTSHQTPSDQPVSDQSVSGQEQPAEISPQSPPSDEELEQMTGLTPNQSYYLLYETFKKLKRTNFSDAAETLKLKRQLLRYHEERKDFNGFDDRYLRQILSNDTNLRDTFNTIAPFFYRQQRDEYRQWGEELEDRRLSLEFSLREAARREEEAENEIGMLKHKVDQQSGQLEVWAKAFDKQAAKAKEEFDRQHGFVEGDEEEEGDAQNENDIQKDGEGGESNPRPPTPSSELGAGGWTYVSQDESTQTEPEEEKECTCHDHDQPDDDCPRKLAELHKQYDLLQSKAERFREENATYRLLIDELTAKVTSLELNAGQFTTHGTKGKGEGHENIDDDGDDVGEIDEEDPCPRKLAKLQKKYTDLMKKAEFYRSKTRSIELLNAGLEKKRTDAENQGKNVYVPYAQWWEKRKMEERNSMLSNENEALEAENAKLRRDASRVLDGENERLRGEVETLGTSHASLEREVQRLEEEMMGLRRENDVLDGECKRLKKVLNEYRDWQEQQKAVEESIKGASGSGNDNLPSSSSESEKPPPTTSTTNPLFDPLPPSTLDPEPLTTTSAPLFPPLPPQTNTSSPPPLPPSSPQPSTLTTSPDLSQYFMNIDPAVPPTASTRSSYSLFTIPESPSFAQIANQIRQTDAYVRHRAQLLRSWKVQYDLQLAESQRRWQEDCDAEERRAEVERRREERRQAREVEAAAA